MSATGADVECCDTEECNQDSETYESKSLSGQAATREAGDRFRVQFGGAADAFSREVKEPGKQNRNGKKSNRTDGNSARHAVRDVQQRRNRAGYLDRNPCSEAIADGSTHDVPSTQFVEKIAQLHLGSGKNLLKRWRATTKIA